MHHHSFPLRGFYSMALSIMLILIFLTAGSAGTNDATSSGCATGFTNPFGCKFAFGSYQSNLLNQLDFVGTWVGDEPNGGLNSWSSSGTNNSCGDCNLVKSVAGQSEKFVVFYAYFIGFQACKKGGYCDCNTQSAPNLCTNGAKWIRDNRAQLIRAYGEYARVVHQNSPNKPVIWWLEGDFIQYSYDDQISPLSYAELGALARDIACAIKNNEPGAIVGMNHSPWINDEQMKGFWGAMPPEIDIVWLQGPGDNNVLNNSWAKTGCYDSLSKYANRRKMMAETSYGTPDRWTTTTVDNINARIAQGVIAVHFNTTPSSSNISTIASYRPQLKSTCTGVASARRHNGESAARRIVRYGNAIKFTNAGGTLCIISMTGQQVMQRATAETGSMDISALPVGVYFIKTGSTMAKFMRQP
ncbi:MAG: T9SS type A sorting domain-containing protein [Chitinispirillaceae bacterium]|nr:T9SS type A sorting domain-containing protein [Chitinispirillaceae bacterium]